MLRIMARPLTQLDKHAGADLIANLAAVALLIHHGPQPFDEVFIPIRLVKGHTAVAANDLSTLRGRIELFQQRFQLTQITLGGVQQLPQSRFILVKQRLAGAFFQAVFDRPGIQRCMALQDSPCCLGHVFATTQRVQLGLKKTVLNDFRNPKHPVFIQKNQANHLGPGAVFELFLQSQIQVFVGQLIGVLLTLQALQFVGLAGAGRTVVDFIDRQL